MKRVFLLLMGALVFGWLAHPALAPIQSASLLARANHSETGLSPQSQKLPASARSAISAAIGRDQASYGALAMRNGFEMKNPQSGLAAEFTPQGVRIRTGAQDSWGFALKAYGEGKHLKPVVEAKPQAARNRVEYRRGTLTEWYVNGPAGLEQGFTIATPPGPGESGTLTLALGLSGNLKATVDANKTGVTLGGDQGGAAYRYAGLSAYDSTGQKLHSRLELRGKLLLLRVNAEGAQFPVIVDPYVQVAKLTIPAAALAVSVSANGQVLVVGAPWATVGSNPGQGAAYVFVKPASGWTSTATFAARLTASNGDWYDQLGYSVGLSADGSTVAVGAPGVYDEAAEIYEGPQGLVYVFVKPSGGWAGELHQTAELKALDIEKDEIGGQLGVSVSVSSDGSTVVTAEIDRYLVNGTAYLFVKPSSGWGNMTETAKLTTTDILSEDLIGGSAVGMSANGSTVVVGHSGTDIARGAAYVFVEPHNGWADETETAKLTASDSQLGGGLGFCVDVSADGSTVAAGAPGAESNSTSGYGAAYVFVKKSGTWRNMTETAKLTSADSFDMGEALSISGDGSTVVIGDRPYALYLYVKPLNGWVSETAAGTELTATDGTVIEPSISADGLTVTAGSHELSAYIFSSAVTFFQFDVQGLQVAGSPRSQFEMNASFILSTSSDGINPVTEPVTLVFGGQVLAIPAGSFRQKNDGNYAFAGRVEGLLLKAEIQVLGSNTYNFLVMGHGANIAGVVNPATVTLSIGNDTGTTQVNTGGQ